MCAGKDAEGKTGDGVGILLQISHKLFKKAVKPLGIELGEERDYGVGMFFFPQDDCKDEKRKELLKKCAWENDWSVKAAELKAYMGEWEKNER